MKTLRVPILFVLLCLFAPDVNGQQISGVVVDRNSGNVLSNVTCENIFTGSMGVSDSAGHFYITAARGELIEFRSTGYKAERMRIPQGNVPGYIKVFLKKTIADQSEYLAMQKAATYHDDSLRYYNLYKHELDFPRFSTLDIIEHPFSAMSKMNQQIWAFQTEYSMFQQEKYIDYTFNENVVANITGLHGDSAQIYLRMFRPKYEQLRNMKEYDFYSYILKSVQMYRTGYNPRRPPSRSAE